MKTLIDVSHTVEEGLITYKGLPAPVICDFLSREESRKLYSPGTEFQIGKIEMVANTGTYVDAPFHRYADGKDLSELDIESVANVEGIVIRCQDRKSRTIDVNLLENVTVIGKAVLFNTGWDKHWKAEQYFEGHPFLTKSVAQYLVTNGAVIVGIDSYNIDDTNDMSRPVHSLLLKNNIPICEHMCGLAALPDTGFRFFATPVKVKHFGTFPVRAFAIIE